MSFLDKNSPSHAPANNHAGHSAYDESSPAGKFLAKTNEALSKLRVASSAVEMREAILLANAALLDSPGT
jgi:hypothetical protein